MLSGVLLIIESTCRYIISIKAFLAAVNLDPKESAIPVHLI